MMRFYFIYGTDGRSSIDRWADGQPFDSGWTEVVAPDGNAACAAFRAVHPDKFAGLLNCSSIITEEQFKCAKMVGPNEDPHHLCHEVITFCHEAITVQRETANRRKVISLRREAANNRKE